MDRQRIAKAVSRWAGTIGGVLLCGSALAVPLVDTGTPADSGSRWVLNYSQWLASEFHVDSATTVTALGGYFGTDMPSDQTVTMSLYGDAGVVPGGAPLFEGKATVAGAPEATAGSSYRFDWAEVSGLSTLLAPGDYWIAFESRAGDGDFVMRGAAPDGLLVNSHRQTKWTENGGYTALQPWEPSTSDLALGIRIESEGVAATASPVPEPGTFLLLGTGLMALAGARRAGGRRQN